MDLNEYIRMFIGLFAIVNPIGVIPLYLNFTNNLQSQRNLIARSTAIAVAIILTISMVMGVQILHFFSISVDAFRVAGGLLLMFIAFNMLEARRGRTRHTPEEDEEAIDSSSVAVVPLALPLLAGPGAISTVILFSNQTKDINASFLLFAIIVAVASFVWITLRLAPQIERHMSQTSMKQL